MAALAVLGAGAWGTAIAIALARSGDALSSRHRVMLWARDAAQARAMAASRRNARYLPEVELPESLVVTHEAHAALSGADLALLATPVAGLRESLARVAGIPFVWLCKGFEQQSAALPHEIVAAVGHPHAERRALRPVVCARGRARIALRADPGGRRRSNSPPPPRRCCTGDACASTIPTT